MKANELEDLKKEIEATLTSISNRQRRCFYEENRILSIVGEDLDAEPRQYANTYTERYGNTIKGNVMTGDYVIGVLRACILAHINERKHLYARARFYADIIINFLEGAPANIKRLSNMNNEIDNRDITKFKRLTLLYVINLGYFSQKTELYKSLMKLNKDFAAECFDAMLEIIIGVDSENQDDLDEYKKLILTYERKLKNANRTIDLLQEDFEQEIEERLAEERCDLMSMLNSRKYGCLIDTLARAQKTFRDIRTSNSEMSKEFMLVENIVRNMMKFIADCDVTPIMEIGDVFTINSSDAKNFIYEGSSFKDDIEEKTVEVVSSGWEIQSSDIVISNPRVAECEEV